MSLDTSAIFKEDKKTIRYYLKKYFYYGISFFILYTLLGAVIIVVSKTETKQTNEHFYQLAPDLIATFTGDMGRISYTIQKALEFNNEATKIFISGVYNKNSIATLMALEKKTLLKNKIDANRFEIDYYARNTFENVLSTFRYLRQNHGIKNIMIISNDYHIMRIRSIFNKLTPANSDYHFYYYGIKTNYLDPRNIKILYKEVYKYIRTYFFLLLFDPQDKMPTNLNPIN